jgi:hypothetical protein
VANHAYSLYVYFELYTSRHLLKWYVRMIVAAYTHRSVVGVAVPGVVGCLLWPAPSGTGTRKTYVGTFFSFRRFFGPWRARRLLLRWGLRLRGAPLRARRVLRRGWLRRSGRWRWLWRRRGRRGLWRRRWLRLWRRGLRLRLRFRWTRFGPGVVVEAFVPACFEAIPLFICESKAE